MSKYDTGNYIIMYFDKKGSKINEESVKDLGLTRSRERAERTIDGEICSYVILRVVANSLD